MSNDEYIDYSCSTPLERLSRDVETLLRSWHIISGSDRHVSFHRKQPRPNLISSRSLSVPSFSVFDDDSEEEGAHTDEEGCDDICGLGMICGSGDSGRRPLSAPLGTVGEAVVEDRNYVKGSSPHKRSSPGARKSLVGARGSPSRSSGSERFQGASRPSPLRSPNRCRSDNDKTPTGTANHPFQTGGFHGGGGGGGVKLIRSGKLTLTTTPPNSPHSPRLPYPSPSARIEIQRMGIRRWWNRRTLYPISAVSWELDNILH